MKETSFMSINTLPNALTIFILSCLLVAVKLLLSLVDNTLS